MASCNSYGLKFYKKEKNEYILESKYNIEYEAENIIEIKENGAPFKKIRTGPEKNEGPYLEKCQFLIKIPTLTKFIPIFFIIPWKISGPVRIFFLLRPKKIF